MTCCSYICDGLVDFNFILDALNSVSWFGDSMLLIIELPDIGSVRSMTPSVQLLWTMVLTSSSS